MLKRILPSFCLFALLLCFGCKPEHNDKKTATSPQQDKQWVAYSPKTIHLYSFKGFPKKAKMEVYKMLKAKYPKIVLEGEVDYPKTAFYTPRNRYWADSLTTYLCRLQPNGDKVVGLASRDISYMKNGSNYGCMGKALATNGRGATFSTFRLKKDGTLQKQLNLLVLHELGHVEGLYHCKDEKCLMQSAKGENIFLKVNDYCPKCKNHLRKRGWKI